MLRPLIFAAVGVFALGSGAPVDASPAASAMRGSVFIDFVRYDPAGADTGSNRHLNKEIVVVTNTTGRPRILTGWTLRDTSHHVYRFPTTRLPAGQSVTVHTGSGTNRRGHRYWGQDFYVWNNTGDKASLRSRAGVLADVCKWGDGGGSTGC